MSPVLSKRGGQWIGWPGLPDEDLPDRSAFAEAAVGFDYDLGDVPLSRAEVEAYYEGYSNSVLWPLFHGFAEHCAFRGDTWEVYQRVNRRFAEVAAERTGADDLVWIHDYQLLLVARFLRELGHRGRLGFFLHIPFPPLEDFVRLPQREHILLAFLAHDLVGFQTTQDRDNFLTCFERLVPRSRQVRDRGHLRRVELDGQDTFVGTFPIGNDVDEFDARARKPRVKQRARELRAIYSHGTLVLGVDRLDPSKGLVQRLRAFEALLDQNPDVMGKIHLLQVVVPSRDSIPHYRRLKREVDEMVGRINGRFGTSGWTPVHYVYGTVNKDELAALYYAADIALVTPLRDGMNLVAKEYCSAQIDCDGVLILREVSGAAAQLRDAAILVNPNATDSITRALRDALKMTRRQRRGRMAAARATLREQDVFWWAEQFLGALAQPAHVTPIEVPSHLPLIARGAPAV